jgi:hypothetical protein
VSNNIDPNPTNAQFLFKLFQNNIEIGSSTMIGGGQYTFTGVPSGITKLVLVPPTGWATSSPLVCSEGGVNPESINVVRGSSVTCGVNTVKLASITVTNFANPVAGTYLYT